MQVGNLLTIPPKQLEAAFVALNLRPLNSGEKKFLSDYHNCLTPVANALKFLEGNKHTFGVYLPMLFSLKQKLTSLKNSTVGNACKPLADALAASFEKRFAKIMILDKDCNKDEDNGLGVPLYLAMVTNPMFKLNFMNQNVIPAEQLNKIRGILFNAGKSNLLYLL